MVIHQAWPWNVAPHMMEKKKTTDTHQAAGLFGHA